MRLLLDTHALLWWLTDDRRLGRHARTLIADPMTNIIVSVASLWEIVVKVRTGKLKAEIAEIEKVLVREGFQRLSITSAHLDTLASLPVLHRDPFDHLLIAQAISEDAVFASDDRNMTRYPVLLQRCGA